MLMTLKPGVSTENSPSFRLFGRETSTSPPVSTILRDFSPSFCAHEAKPEPFSTVTMHSLPKAITTVLLAVEARKALPSG